MGDRRGDYTYANRALIIVAIILFCLIVYLLYFSDISNAANLSDQEFLPSFDFGYVTEVIDGDTIVADLYFRGKNIHIRFAHIDAFELHNNRHIIKQEQETEYNATKILQLGQEARNVMYKLLPPGTPILIVLDSDHHYGSFGRLLGTIYKLAYSNQTAYQRAWAWMNVNQYVLNKYPNLFLKVQDY